jgi:hypothetical protein
MSTTLSTDRIDVTIDAANRPVVVISDESAVRLNTTLESGWTDGTSMVPGHSAFLQPDTWESQFTCAILDAVAACPEVNEDARRFAAQPYGAFYGCIVGAGDWCSATNWWNDYTANVHLHVRGCPMKMSEGIRYGG